MRTPFALLFAISSFSCMAEVDSEPSEDLGHTLSAVQSAYVNDQFTVASEASGPLHDATAATGTVFTPWFKYDRTPERAVDGTPLRGSCGVTFVSPRYAITAAHCVDAGNVWDPPNQPLTVQRYRVSGPIDISGATQLNNAFPAYTHGTLGPAQRYVTDRFECRLVSRCGYGEYQCAVNEPDRALRSDVDIALLKCTLRPDPSVYGYAPLAADDNAWGPVKMFWSHEIYGAPTEEPYGGIGPGVDYAAYDRWRHYTFLDAEAENFHYFGNERNQLLPLVSRDWYPRDIPIFRRRLGRDGTVVWTDLFGCHGSSGSGVMQFNQNTGKYELLGPAIRPDVRAFGGDGRALCVSAETHAPGERSLAYEALKYTQQMAQVAYADCFEGFKTCTFTPYPRPKPFPKLFGF